MTQCPKCKAEINADWMPIGTKGKKWLKIKLDEGSYGEWHNCDEQKPQLGQVEQKFDHEIPMEQKPFHYESFPNCTLCNTWFSPKLPDFYELFAKHNHEVFT